MAEPAPVIDDLRAIAAARASTLGLPTSALEDWRYVRCDTLSQATYATPRKPTIEELRSWVDHTQRALVLVDGRFHSMGHGDWPAAWQPTLPSAADDAAAAESLREELDVAACWAVADGTCRQVLRVVATHNEPLHVVNLCTGGTSGFSIGIEVAPGSSLDLVVRHIQLAPARSCPAISIRAGRGARVQVSEIQATAWEHLLGTTTLKAAADAHIAWTSIARGGACVRLQTRMSITGRGGHLAYAALGEARGIDQIHHLSRLTHAIGDSTSEQLVKAVLHDRANASFDGLVRILAGCDGANAEQQNRNLLLSDLARADTRPQLDIKADDVKAAHGATVGQPDADELLYLRMRGIPVADARGLLTAGFTGEVISRLAHPEFLP